MYHGHTPRGKTMKIDQECATEVKKERLRMNQEQAYTYYEKLGKRMLNTNDLEEIEDEVTLQNIKQEMKDDYVLFGNKIEYEKDSLNATITPHKGKPIILKIPVVWGEFDKKNQEQVNYLKALLGDKAIELLEKWSEGKKIWLYTPNQSERASRPIRAVRLCFNWDRFDVDGDSWVDGNGGCSHGVSSDSEPKARSK